MQGANPPDGIRSHLNKWQKGQIHRARQWISRGYGGGGVRGGGTGDSGRGRGGGNKLLKGMGFLSEWWPHTPVNKQKAKKILYFKWKTCMTHESYLDFSSSKGENIIAGASHLCYVHVFYQCQTSVSENYQVRIINVLVKRPKMSRTR